MCGERAVERAWYRNARTVARRNLTRRLASCQRETSLEGFEPTRYAIRCACDCVCGVECVVGAMTRWSYTPRSGYSFIRELLVSDPRTDDDATMTRVTAAMTAIRTAIIEAERRPKVKQVVFYCGCSAVTPGRELARKMRKPLDSEVKIESLTELWEWTRIQVVAGRSYYVDVREE